MKKKAIAEMNKVRVWRKGGEGGGVSWVAKHRGYFGRKL